MYIGPDPVRELERIRIELGRNGFFYRHGILAGMFGAFFACLKLYIVQSLVLGLGAFPCNFLVHVLLVSLLCLSSLCLERQVRGGVRDLCE